MKSLSFKKKSLSPLISVILLVVVAVILVSLVLSFGKTTINSNLDKPKDLFKEDTSLTGFIYTEKAKEDSFFLKNLSSKPITFTHYQLVGDENFFIYNYKLSLDPITVSAGSSFPIPVICSPSSEYKINLITEEGNYISTTVKNVKDYENNPCSVPNIPSPVCLGLEENGTGEDENNLKHICNVNDLDDVRNNLDGHYILGANIDMNVSPYNEGEGWEPIGSCGENEECYNGNYTYAFIGTFDGGGYTISNLYINKPYTENVGLFGYANNATITNVKLENVDINGYIYVGGLVGSFNEGSITNSYSTGFVSGEEIVGGLVGESSGEISNSYSTGSVSGDYGIGGLVGSSEFSSISNSYSTGAVSGKESVGGLVGNFYDGYITNSYSTGSVSGKGYVGGLVGSSSEASITNSYSTGSVSGINSVGGLVGSFSAPFSSSSITNCYSTGSVSGTGNSVGGLVGNFYEGSITNSYYDKDTSGQTDTGKGEPLTTQQMKTKDLFNNWDFEGVWQINEGVTYPYLIDNPQTPPPKPSYDVLSNYLSGIYNTYSLLINLTSYADTIYYTINGSDPTCSGIGEHYTSPITITTGTTTIKAIVCKEGYDNKVFDFRYVLPEPTFISTLQDLDNVRNDLQGFYVLGANIDMNVSPYNEEEGWEPIGSCGENGECYNGNYTYVFTGGFDGSGYTISNLYINRPDTEYAGLFGFTSNAIMTNVKLEYVNITGNCRVGGLVGSSSEGFITNSYSTGSVSGTGYSVGGLVGSSEFSSISSSYSTGSVSGENSVGGLVGYSYYASISRSYSTGSVSGENSVGGLVGFSDSSSISSSYSTGSVSGNFRVGGLVGESYGEISNSYSTGSVSGENRVGGLIGYKSSGTVTNSFWDTITSGTTISADGTGKTTTQMKTQSTFTGWEFPNIWKIISGVNNGYPHLVDNPPI